MFPLVDDPMSSQQDQPRWAAPVPERDAASPQGGHIPTGVMLDFAYGGLDEELLFALYGGHLRSCAVCTRGFEVYRRHRPSDPARLYEVAEFAACQHERAIYPLSPEDAGNRLKSFLAAGTGPLLIVAGEANPAVYNESLREPFLCRAAAARRAGESLPKVICGPAMGLDQNVPTPEETVFPALAAEGAIQLFITEHRQRLHFRVSGDDAVYTEEYHEAGNPGDRRGYRYQSRPIARLFRRRFEAILAAGLARPATRDAFVYLPMEKIREIQGRVGAAFDSMTAADLAGAAAL